MNGLDITFAILAAVFLLLVLALIAFGVRPYQQPRTLGTIDASHAKQPGTGQKGGCSYTDTHLEWLRLRSLSPKPRFKFRRSSLELQGWRQPTEAERAKIQPGAIVVMLTHERQALSMAMTFDVYAGLSSWLEAGPVIGIGTWR
ncbi:DUF2550 family protein [Arthrobacter sp.]|uniref:DUF2550 family protein n=1 Tax=Arthrobacter sp. TaxID=1667 RepID=UPI0033974A99